MPEDDGLVAFLARHEVEVRILGHPVALFLLSLINDADCWLTYMEVTRELGCPYGFATEYCIWLEDIGMLTGRYRRNEHKREIRLSEEGRALLAKLGFAAASQGTSPGESSPASVWREVPSQSVGSTPGPAVKEVTPPTRKEPAANPVVQRREELLKRTYEKTSERLLELEAREEGSVYRILVRVRPSGGGGRAGNRLGDQTVEADWTAQRCGRFHWGRGERL